MKVIALPTTLLTIATITLPALAPAAMAEQQTSLSAKTEIKATTTSQSQSLNLAVESAQVATPARSTKPAGRKIPVDSAIVVGFPHELSLDASKTTMHMLQLAQPIYDANGEELIPVNAYINTQLKPTQEGIEVIADAVTVKGRRISLKTNSVMIPGQTLTIKSGMDQAKENRQAGSGILGSFLGAFGAGGEAMERGMLLGNGIGWMTGLGSGQKILVVKIPQGTVHMLSTTAEVAIP